MKGLLALAAVAVASVALTAAVMAGGMHHGMHAHAVLADGFDGFVEKTLNDLDVTDSQRTKVLAVTDRMTAGFAKFHGAHAEMHAAFLREWGKDTMDQAQLDQLVDAKLEELRGSLHQVVDGVAEIHDTLTPEQRRRLTTRMQEMHGHP